MAKSPKKKKSKVEDVIEAETSKGVDETTKTAEADVVSPEDVAPAKDVVSEAKGDDAATSTKDSDVASTDEVADKANVEEKAVDDIEVKDSETVDAEVIEEIDAEVVEEIAPEPAVVPAEAKEGSGFFPLLFGGVIAGGIGFGIATFLQPEDNSAQLTELLNSQAEQAEQISDLQAQLENLPTPDVSDQITTGLGDLPNQITEIQDRLQVVERQPNADGTLSETALAAYQAELDALRSELDEQQNAVMSAASQAGADLAAARAEAERLEQEALAAAEAAVARAAINRIATAVDTGAPFADALGDLDTSDVPAAFVDAAETGVTTSADLKDDFPAAARAALATARSEGESDDAGGLSGFLLSQFNVRSTSPQEGSSPDAILSRAEAAVKEDRVADALAEIEALPEVARAEITEWTARAQERADVLDAIAILSETYQ